MDEVAKALQRVARAVRAYSAAHHDFIAAGIELEDAEAAATIALDNAQVTA